MLIKQFSKIKERPNILLHSSKIILKKSFINELRKKVKRHKYLLAHIFNFFQKHIFSCFCNAYQIIIRTLHTPQIDIVEIYLLLCVARAVSGKCVYASIKRVKMSSDESFFANMNKRKKRQRFAIKFNGLSKTKANKARRRDKQWASHAQTQQQKTAQSLSPNLL